MFSRHRSCHCPEKRHKSVPQLSRMSWKVWDQQALVPPVQISLSLPFQRVHGQLYSRHNVGCLLPFRSCVVLRRTWGSHEVPQKVHERQIWFHRKLSFCCCWNSSSQLFTKKMFFMNRVKSLGWTISALSVLPLASKGWESTTWSFKNVWSCYLLHFSSEIEKFITGLGIPSDLSEPLLERACPSLLTFQ